MGDFVRNCKRMAEIAVMETSSSSSSLSKKKKYDFGIENLNLLSDLSFFGSISQEKIVSPPTYSNSGGVLAEDFCLSVCSCDSTSPDCSSNESSHLLKDSFRLLDLEAKSFETETSTCIDNKVRETTPSSKFCGDKDEMDSTAEEKTNGRKKPVAKMPDQAEIEEFFAVAEKEEQKRFTEKYNYDIMKDVPLEGRYQWVRLKHEEREEVGEGS